MRGARAISRARARRRGRRHRRGRARRPDRRPDTRARRRRAGRRSGRRLRRHRRDRRAAGRDRRRRVRLPAGRLGAARRRLDGDPRPRSRAPRPPPRARSSALAVSAFGGEVVAESVNVHAGAAAGSAGCDRRRRDVLDLGPRRPRHAGDGEVRTSRSRSRTGARSSSWARRARPPMRRARPRARSRACGSASSRPMPACPSARRSSWASSPPARSRRQSSRCTAPGGTVDGGAVAPALASTRAAPDGAAAARADGTARAGPLDPGRAARARAPRPRGDRPALAGRLRVPRLRAGRLRQHVRRLPGRRAGKWHHGEDLVAPIGTPLLAVADGSLFSVGWNDVGGWRLWLRDDGGNEFYYAHLSAYSPLAIAGKRVKAGDVLGFVGRRGDAEGGVPHLHFEIHPRRCSSTATTAPSRRTRSSSPGGARRTSRSTPGRTYTSARTGSPARPAPRSPRPAPVPSCSTRATSRPRAASCPGRCSGRSPGASPAAARSLAVDLVGGLRGPRLRRRGCLVDLVRCGLGGVGRRVRSLVHRRLGLRDRVGGVERLQRL